MPLSNIPKSPEEAKIANHLSREHTVASSTQPDSSATNSEPNGNADVYDSTTTETYKKSSFAGGAGMGGMGN